MADSYVLELYEIFESVDDSKYAVRDKTGYSLRYFKADTSDLLSGRALTVDCLFPINHYPFIGKKVGLANFFSLECLLEFNRLRRRIDFQKRNFEKIFPLPAPLGIPDPLDYKTYCSFFNSRRYIHHERQNRTRNTSQTLYFEIFVDPLVRQLCHLFDKDPQKYLLVSDLSNSEIKIGRAYTEKTLPKDVDIVFRDI